MLGWYFDEILVFVIRSLISWVKLHRSRAWPDVQGTVVKVDPPQTSFWPQAEIVYTYTVEDKAYAGVHKRAFWLNNSAKDYAARFAPGGTINVRFRPAEPTESCAPGVEWTSRSGYMGSVHLEIG